MARDYKLPSEVVWSGMLAAPPQFVRAERLPRNAARKNGVKYERTAQEYLLGAFRGQYLPSPWLAFRLRDEAHTRFCQPDGLVFDWTRHAILVVEIKYRHTPEAWHQVTQLYLPVLRHLFRNCQFQFRCCEVVRWYDPATYFPAPFAMVSDPALTPLNKFGVFIWKKRAWMDDL